LRAEKEATKAKERAEKDAKRAIEKIEKIKVLKEKYKEDARTSQKCGVFSKKNKKEANQECSQRFWFLPIV